METTALSNPLGAAFRSQSSLRFSQEYVEAVFHFFLGLAPFPGKANGDTVVSVVLEWQPGETELRKQWRPKNGSVGSIVRYLAETDLREDISSQQKLAVSKSVRRLSLNSKNSVPDPARIKPRSPWFTLLTEYQSKGNPPEFHNREFRMYTRAPCATDPESAGLKVDWVAIMREYLETVLKAVIAVTLAMVLIFLRPFAELSAHPIAFHSTIMVIVIGQAGKTVGGCLEALSYGGLGLGCGSLCFFVLGVLGERKSPVGQGVVFAIFVYLMALIRHQGARWVPFYLYSVLFAFQGIYTSIANDPKDRISWLVAYFQAYGWGMAIVLVTNLVVWPVSSESSLRELLIRSLDHVSTLAHLICKSHAREITPDERDVRDLLIETIRQDFSALTSRMEETSFEILYTRWSMSMFREMIHKIRGLQQRLLLARAETASTFGAFRHAIDVVISEVIDTLSDLTQAERAARAASALPPGDVESASPVQSRVETISARLRQEVRQSSLRHSISRAHVRAASLSNPSGALDDDDDDSPFSADRAGILLLRGAWDRFASAQSGGILALIKSEALQVDDNLKILEGGPSLQSLGQSLRTFLLQLFGTAGGAIAGLIILEIFKNVGGYHFNPYGLIVFMALWTIPASYFLYRDPKWYSGGLLAINGAGSLLIEEWLSNELPSLKALGPYPAPAARAAQVLAAMSIAIAIAIVLLFRTPARRQLRLKIAAVTFSLSAYNTLLQSHADIIALTPLFLFAELEPSLAAPFQGPVLLKIIGSHQIVLDRLREARTAVGRGGFNASIHRDFITTLYPYRLHSQRLARTLFYLCATSLQSKTPLPRDVPSSKGTWASFENDALVLSRRMSQMPHREHELREPGFLRYWFYLCSVGAVSRELEQLETYLGELFGVPEETNPWIS
ncbi:hypothetical protein RQP46_004035 [Phenoliferia psychrophenolica]